MRAHRPFPQSDVCQRLVPGITAGDADHPVSKARMACETAAKWSR